MFTNVLTHFRFHCSGHWQMVVILPKEHLVVWFCSVHNRPDNYLKGIINRLLFILIFWMLCDASSIGACRPRIFFINGFLCFLEDEWQRNGEGREREDATSRRR